MPAVIFAASGIPAGAGKTAIRRNKTGPVSRAMVRRFMEQKDKTLTEICTLPQIYFAKNRRRVLKTCRLPLLLLPDC
jgi:putative intracellular protease/amidase